MYSVHDCKIMDPCNMDSLEDVSQAKCFYRKEKRKK